MPNTAKGTPYVQGSDLVSAYPTVSSNLATHIDDNLAYNAVTINAQTGTTYTFVIADASAGKLVTASNAGSQTYTVPPQSSVTWADGAVLRILNQGAGVVTIAAGAGVTINGTPLTLNQYAGAALQRTASNTWTIVPFTGGVGNANFSDAATGTYTSGGINYKYITYTASGTLTVSTAGFADVLVVGGGGGGAGRAGGGGGAGGYLSVTDAYLPSGSLTVTVGAGGAAGGVVSSIRYSGAQGQASRVGSYYAVGGGGGGTDTSGGTGPTTSSGAAGSFGGSGGGSGGAGAPYSGTAGGAAVSGQGNAGGSNIGNYAGGGGGAGAVGGNGSGTTAGSGGTGTASSITGSSVTRAGGGGAGSAGGTAGSGGTGGGGGGTNSNTTATAGTANTGGGGGGGGNTSGDGGLGAAGGSGVVIIRVRT